MWHLSPSENKMSNARQMPGLEMGGIGTDRADMDSIVESTFSIFAHSLAPFFFSAAFSVQEFFFGIAPKIPCYNYRPRTRHAIFSYFMTLILFVKSAC